MGALAAVAVVRPFYTPRARHAHGDRLLLVGAALGKSHAVAAINMATGAQQLTPISFKAHAFVQDPVNTHQVWAFQKWGPKAAVIDMSEGRVIREISARDNRWFFGHGTLLPNTRVVVSSQASLDTSHGYLVGYDLDRFEVVSVSKVTDGWLHDVKSFADGSVVVAHSGFSGGKPLGKKEWFQLGPSGLVKYDVRNQKMLGNIYTEDAEQVITHFSLFSDNKVMALSSNFFGTERKELREKAAAAGAMLLRFLGVIIMAIFMW